MHREGLLGPWVRRFLLEHIVDERNFSSNTQRSYRDTLALLLPFVSAEAGRPLDRLEVTDLSAPRVRLFLKNLEQTRGVGVTTRNQRLAAIRSLARFVAEHSPQHVAWYGEVKTVPFKKTVRNLISYLEKAEVEALLTVPDCTTPLGRRNHALLLFLYNSGARVSEAAGLCIADLDLTTTATPSVRILGKGMKERRCPLWRKTATELAQLVERRSASERVFLNRRRQPLTRFGIYNLLKVCVARARKGTPSLLTKRVSPHTLRHSTATHLLRAGVDIDTIRSWLGHVCLDTTQVYAEMDLEKKARALEKCDTMEAKRPTVESSAPLMDFLRAI
jgi:site-specific recombinase XerD